LLVYKRQKLIEKIKETIRDVSHSLHAFSLDCQRSNETKDVTIL
jgi:hypothetical protein